MRPLDLREKFNLLGRAVRHSAGTPPGETGMVSSLRQGQGAGLLPVERGDCWGDKLLREQLAQTLKVNQSAISKLERRADMYVSTLQRMIEAMGGSLEIRANFPEGSVLINQFSENSKSAA